MVIDEEFKNLLPPLSADEFRDLEANCVRDGIRDPLVVWPQDDGNDILVDGHNRFRISAMHSGIRFDIKRIEFKSRDEAKRWIILNQFGRRNLSAYDRSVLALKLKPMIAEKAKERQNLGLKSDEGMRTDETLGKIAGVGKDTVRKVEVIEEKATPAIKEDVKSGDLSINKAYQIVTGTVSKSPKKAMDEFVQSRREAHEEFKRQKEGAVVGLRGCGRGQTQHGSPDERLPPEIPANQPPGVRHLFRDAERRRHRRCIEGPDAETEERDAADLETHNGAVSAYREEAYRK